MVINDNASVVEVVLLYLSIKSLDSSVPALVQCVCVSGLKFRSGVHCHIALVIFATSIPIRFQYRVTHLVDNNLPLTWS